MLLHSNCATLVCRPAPFRPTLAFRTDDKTVKRCCLYIVYTYLCNHILPKLGAQTVVRRGSGTPSTDGPGTCQHLIGPDFPSIETRQLVRGFQIGMFRTIRVDHTNWLQVGIKTHSFNSSIELSHISSRYSTQGSRTTTCGQPASTFRMHRYA